MILLALYLSSDQQPNALVFENVHFIPKRDPTEAFSLDDLKDVVGSGFDVSMSHTCACNYE